MGCDMSVSKKDSIAVAKILQFEQLDLQDGAGVEGSIERLAGKFADYFYAENGMFDRERFINACGLEN